MCFSTPFRYFCYRCPHPPHASLYFEIIVRVTRTAGICAPATRYKLSRNADAQTWPWRRASTGSAPCLVDNTNELTGNLVTHADGPWPRLWLLSITFLSSRLPVVVCVFEKSNLQICRFDFSVASIFSSAFIHSFLSTYVASLRQDDLFPRAGMARQRIEFCLSQQHQGTGLTAIHALDSIQSCASGAATTRACSAYVCSRAGVIVCLQARATGSSHPLSLSQICSQIALPASGH